MLKVTTKIEKKTVTKKIKLKLKLDYSGKNMWINFGGYEKVKWFWSYNEI